MTKNNKGSIENVVIRWNKTKDFANNRKLFDRVYILVYIYIFFFFKTKIKKEKNPALREKKKNVKK